ncbi:MAG: hypothetical protein EPO52_09210 [Herbiconiux sp.]|uniref:hypothetical protein n=1 Tax=Herbiconiux sp. TaxID=1871186 RepID=UPI00120EFA15|nr:hypothetical protein [Herbiconiux sp.]TAJ48319.1 MAG: hypothetical protein EPO52_09210 [Herbiconiux sp.]
MGDFSLIPSAIVFGLVLVGLIGGATVIRRRSRRSGRLVGGATNPAPAIGGAPLRESLPDLVKRANIQLVQMDDAIRAGDDEAQFARAEFGEQSALEFEAALATARQRASEAFALKQRLDDAVPDTEQQQRDWSKRILALSDSALALVTAQTRALGERRRLESTAPQEIRRVRTAIDAARAQLPDARATLETLSARYRPTALTAVVDNPDSAEELFDRADSALAAAESDLANSAITPIARSVQQADAAVREGRARLDAIARARDSLATAEATRMSALDAARTRLAEATHLRARVEDADAVARIVAGQSQLEQLIGRITSESTPGDPIADIDALDAASAALDATLAVARSAQQRLDSARHALVGATAIARSHIGTADDAIGSGRGRVGPDARTRLAAARRELELAEQESDPVAALDGARRAATLATDADALARYDLRGAHE